MKPHRTGLLLGIFDSLFLKSRSAVRLAVISGIFFHVPHVLAQPMNTEASSSDYYLGRAYCLYLSSVPDSEPDQIEEDYSKAIESATSRLQKENPSMSYLQALWRVREICMRHTANDGE